MVIGITKIRLLRNIMILMFSIFYWLSFKYFLDYDIYTFYLNLIVPYKKNNEILSEKCRWALTIT